MEDLRDYKTVDLWIKKASGSEVTTRVYLNKFQKFLVKYDINPDEVIAKWKEVRYDWKERQKFLDFWSELIEEYFTTLEEFSPLGKRASITPILSFFQHHKIKLDLEINNKVFVKYKTRDISKEEIRRILSHVGIREKAFYLMMLESGLRPRTLVKLRYANIKEDFENSRVPMKIDVPAQIAKDRVGNRFSFVGTDAFDALKEYLSSRLPLDDNDLLFVSRKGELKNSYLSPETFSKIFSNVVLKLNLEKRREAGKPKSLRMYTLRKYFRNNINVEFGYREFWLGHKFGTDEHYITRNIEKHREIYQQAYKNVRIYADQNLAIEDLRQKYEDSKRKIEKLAKQIEDQQKVIKMLDPRISDKEFFRLYEDLRKRS